MVRILNDESENAPELNPPPHVASDPASNKADEGHDLPRVTVGANNDASELSKLHEGKLKVRFRWLDVRYSVQEKVEGKKGEKVILNGVSGEVLPGKMLAVMGASGSGKTTLLNCLAARTTFNVTGTITVNNKVVPPSWLKRCSGYVTQDSVYLATLTVREILVFAARLRLPYSTPSSIKMQRVDQVIKDLDLVKCQNTRVGDQAQRGISGGEMRRLIIGVELLNDPSILFLDEPTSGLDSASSLMVVRLLKKLAFEQNRTIICTIHQPRMGLFHMFDDVLLLAAGNTVYYGSPRTEVVDHFARAGFVCPRDENPADFLLDLVNTKDSNKKTKKRKSSTTIEMEPTDEEKAELSREETINKLVTHYKDAVEQGILPNPIKEQNEGDITARSANLDHLQGYTTPAWYQFLLIFHRSLVYKLREPSAVATQVFTSIMMAFLIGTAYWQIDTSFVSKHDRTAAISFFMTSMAFMSMDQIVLFPKEREVYLRDHASGMYGTAAFFCGRTFAEVPFHIVISFAGAAMAYYMAGLQPDAEKFFTFALIVVVLTLTGVSFLCACGAMSKNLAMANVVATLLLVFFMLFDGFYVKESNIPAAYRWLAALSYLGYAVQASIKNEFTGLTFEGVPLPDGSFGPNVTGTEALAEIDMADVDIGMNLIYLLIMMVVFRFLAYLFLKYLYNRKSWAEEWAHLVGKA